MEVLHLGKGPLKHASILLGKYWIESPQLSIHDFCFLDRTWVGESCKDNLERGFVGNMNSGILEDQFFIMVADWFKPLVWDSFSYENPVMFSQEIPINLR